MKKKTSPQDPATIKTKYTIEANNPYNDKWTKEAYRKELKKIERQEEIIKNISYIGLMIAVPAAIWILLYWIPK